MTVSGGGTLSLWSSSTSKLRSQTQLRAAGRNTNIQCSDPGAREEDSRIYGGSLSVVHIYLFNFLTVFLVFHIISKGLMSQTTDLAINRPFFSIPNRASSSDFHSSQMEKQNSILLHFIALQVARRNSTANPSFLHISLLPFLCRSFLVGAVCSRRVCSVVVAGESIPTAGSVAPIPQGSVGNSCTLKCQGAFQRGQHVEFPVGQASFNPCA